MVWFSAAQPPTAAQIVQQMNPPNLNTNNVRPTIINANSGLTSVKPASNVPPTFNPPGVGPDGKPLASATAGIASSNVAAAAFADPVLLRRVANLGLCASLACMASPASFFYEMIKSNGDNIASSEGQLFLVLPYLLTTVQCVLWMIYGVLEADAAMFQLNALGTCIYGMYTIIYNVYASPKQKWNMRMTTFGSFFILYCYSYKTFYYEEKTVAAGMFASWATVVVFGLYLVPFLQLVDAWKTGVVDVFPLPLAMCSVFSCTLWTYYSYLQKDFLMLVSNGMGIIFNGIQVGVVLYIYKKFSRKIVKECELDRMDQLRATIMPFQSDLKRRINLSEAKQMRNTGAKFTSLANGLPRHSTYGSHTNINHNNIDGTMNSGNSATDHGPLYSFTEGGNGIPSNNNSKNSNITTLASQIPNSGASSKATIIRHMNYPNRKVSNNQGGNNPNRPISSKERRSYEMDMEAAISNSVSNRTKSPDLTHASNIQRPDIPEIALNNEKLEVIGVVDGLGHSQSNPLAMFAGDEDLGI